MKKNLKLKKLGLVMMMSLIVISVLSVSGYAATTPDPSKKVNLSLHANTSDGFISGDDGTIAHTLEFTYNLSYVGPTTVSSTGYVNVKPNTDRGGTAGGTISAAFQRKYGLVWETVAKSYGQSVVIENVPRNMTYSYGAGTVPTYTFVKGTTYRGKFEVEYLCCPAYAANVKVHPAINYFVYVN